LTGTSAGMTSGMQSTCFGHRRDGGRRNQPGRSFGERLASTFRSKAHPPPPYDVAVRMTGELYASKDPRRHVGLPRNRLCQLRVPAVLQIDKARYPSADRWARGGTWICIGIWSESSVVRIARQWAAIGTLCSSHAFPTIKASSGSGIASGNRHFDSAPKHVRRGKGTLVCPNGFSRRQGPNAPASPDLLKGQPPPP
jgi:hypothetical protein